MKAMPPKGARDALHSTGFTESFGLGSPLTFSDFCEEDSAVGECAAAEASPSVDFVFVVRLAGPVAVIVGPHHCSICARPRPLQTLFKVEGLQSHRPRSCTIYTLATRSPQDEFHGFDRKFPGKCGVLFLELLRNHRSFISSHINSVALQ